MSERKSLADIYYYRQRFRNRLNTMLVEAVVESGLKKKDIAEILGKEPSQITRWLNSSRNVHTDTISDLLLAVDRELDFRPVSIHGETGNESVESQPAEIMTTHEVIEFKTDDAGVSATA